MSSTGDPTSAVAAVVAYLQADRWYIDIGMVGDDDEWIELAEDAIRALRSLPVEQRMKAMGMIEAPFVDTRKRRCWVEAK